MFKSKHTTELFETYQAPFNRIICPYFIKAGGYVTVIPFTFCSPANTCFLREHSFLFCIGDVWIFVSGFRRNNTVLFKFKTVIAQ